MTKKLSKRIRKTRDMLYELSFQLDSWHIGFGEKDRRPAIKKLIKKTRKQLNRLRDEL